MTEAARYSSMVAHNEGKGSDGFQSTLDQRIPDSAKTVLYHEVVPGTQTAAGGVAKEDPKSGYITQKFKGIHTNAYSSPGKPRFS